METLTTTEQRVLDALDTDEMLADLAALVAIPSVGGTPAEGDAQAWCGDRLRGLGLAVDEWDIDIAAERAAEGFPGMEVERAAARGCVAVLGGPTVPDRTGGCRRWPSAGTRTSCRPGTSRGGRPRVRSCSGSRTGWPTAAARAT